MKNTLKKHCLFLLAVLSLSSIGILAESKGTPGIKIKKEDCANYPVASEIIKKFRELYKKEGSKESKFSTQTVRDSDEDLSISACLPNEVASEGDLVDISLDTRVKSVKQFPGMKKKRFLTPKLLEKYAAKQNWKEYFFQFSSKPSEGSWRALDDCTQCQSYVEGKNGLRGWEEEERFRCNTVVPRKIFNAIFHATGQKGEEVDTSSAVSQPTKPNTNTKSPAPSKSTTGENWLTEPKQECTLQEKNACYTLLRALLETHPIHEKDKEGNVILDFDLPISEKMKGYTAETAALDKRIYNGLPSPDVTDLCKDDVACVATWFFWQKSHRPGKVANQYSFGKDGQDGELLLTSGGPGSAARGSFSLSKEEFERVKKEVKNRTYA